MSPMPLPIEVVRLRDRLRQISVMELKARGLEALRQCRPEVERLEPLSVAETLVKEIRAEWQRRFPREPRQYAVSKGLDF
jgi:hypothetical protein